MKKTYLLKSAFVLTFLAAAAGQQAQAMKRHNKSFTQELNHHEDGGLLGGDHVPGQESLSEKGELPFKLPQDIRALRKLTSSTLNYKFQK